MRTRSILLGATLAGLLWLAACGQPPFVVHVIFPGSVEIEEGAPVLYEGLVIGRVASVSLRQESPERPAQVQLSLAISDPRITLRERDAFHVTFDSSLGKRVLRVVPAPEPSSPLEPGATVAGVPPLVTRVDESLDAAVEAFTDLAAQAAQQALEELSKSLEQQRSEGPGAPPAAPPPPAPEPRPPGR